MKYDAITSAALAVLSRGEVSPSLRKDALISAIDAKYPGAVGRARTKRRNEVLDSKFSGPVPAWAKRLVIKHAGKRMRHFTVRQSRIKNYSSGHCWYSGDITVTFSKAGSDVREQQSTVLHEIAHIYAAYDGHGDRFYDAWYKMLKAENLYRYTLDCGRFVGGSSLRAAARRARVAVHESPVDSFERSAAIGRAPSS